ncbi:MAG: carboxypeptidase-like regulatory domain-containing protein, partial [Planctomycetota bacterium]|nr:carboxypeptidase-like regulatory domain-containing protein [Planctomycetota bacterium]
AFAANRGQEGDAARAYTESTEGVNFYLFPGVTLSGRVISPDDRPVPGARVMLLDPTMIFGRGMPKAETTTAPDGTFSIWTMPQDQALLVVRAPGFASYMEGDLKLPQHDKRIQLELGITVQLRAVRKGQEQLPAPEVKVAVMYHGNFAVGVSGPDGRLTVPNLPAKSSGGMGSRDQAMFWGGGFVQREVSLQKHEPVDGVIDLGDVALERGGTIRGKVVDADTGEPIAGASLRALGGVAQEVGMFGASKATSGPDGAFELVGVPLKASALLAQHADYQLNENPMALMMRGGRNGVGGKPLFPEGETELDTVVSLKPAATITGFVRAPDGTPVAGAEVTVRDQMMMGLAMMLGIGSATAESDAEGKFTLKGLTPGQAVPIVATHREWGSSPAKSAHAGKDPVVLELSVPLSLQGVVKDERGKPVAGVRVTVSRVGEQRGRSGMNPMQQATTTRPGISDETGAWVIRNAPVGNLEVTFEHGHYEEQTTAVSVNASQTEKDLGETVLARGHGIQGTVYGADGEPLRGVRVNAMYRHTGASEANVKGRTYGRARTDEKGVFEIYGLREGEFGLSATFSGLYGTPVNARTGTTEVRIEMRSAGRLSGVVIGDDGKPVVGAQVNAQTVRPSAVAGRPDLHGVGWAQTDAGGGFAFDALPPDTTFRLSIRHDAYKTFETEMNATDAEQRFTLLAGNRLEGSVFDESRNPVSNANVTIMMDGRHVKSVRTDGTGRFRVGGLGDGAFMVMLQSSEQNYIPTKPVAVEIGARNIELIARPGESIAGRLIGPDGKPRRQLQVAALSGETQVGQTWAWSQDGTFTINGLPKGIYTLRVTRYVQGEEPKSVTLEDVATGTTDAELTVPD